MHESVIFYIFVNVKCKAINDLLVINKRKNHLHHRLIKRQTVYLVARGK